MEILVFLFIIIIILGLINETLLYIYGILYYFPSFFIFVILVVVFVFIGLECSFWTRYIRELPRKIEEEYRSKIYFELKEYYSKTVKDKEI